MVEDTVMDHATPQIATRRNAADSLWVLKVTRRHLALNRYYIVSP